MGYKAILFSDNGDWVTDCEADTKDEVLELLADIGSRWIFYPNVAVITNNGSGTTNGQRLCSPLYTRYGEMPTLKGWTINLVRSLLVNNMLDNKENE